MTISIASVAVSALGGHVVIGTRNHPGSQRVVWLHGLGGAATTTFAEIIEHSALAATTAHLIDLPGHGQSDRPAEWSYTIEAMAEVAAQAIEAVARGPVAVVGHSMGGSVAIALAHRYPHLLRSLIVAEPNLDPGVGTISAHIARQLESRFVTHGFRALVHAMQNDRTGTHAASTWPDTLAEASPVALHRASTSLLAEREPTFRSMLEELALPVMFIAGDQTRPIESLLPAPPVEMVVIPEAGHEMWADNPNVFAETVARGITAT